MDEPMEQQNTNESNGEAGHSGCRETTALMTSKFNNEETDESSDWVEFVEEKFVHVVVDNLEDMSTVNTNSNVRMNALDTDSPVLQIEKKIFHLNEWKYIPGTAMFFEQKREAKIIDPLYDNRCGIDLEYIGSTHKCLEMTKKESAL